MQRWGSEQAPGSSVLLRTGALMSLASLGTAGLVLCGALAVGGPSGTGFPGALGRGPAAVPAQEVDETEEPTLLAAPSVRRRSATPDAPRGARPAAGPDEAPPQAVRTVDALAGTTSSAARTSDDLDSVAHPAREQVDRTASAPAPALRGTAGAPDPAAPAPAGPQPVVAAPAEPVAEAPRAPRAAKAARAPEAAKAAPVARAPKAAPVARAPKAAPVARAPKAAPVAKAPKPPVAQVARASKGPEAAKPSRPAQVHKAPASTAAAPAPAAPAEAPAEQGKGGHGGGDHPHGGAPGQDQRQDAGQDKGNGPEH